MEALKRELETVDPRDANAILSRALDHFGEKIALSVSFQIGGLAILDMIHKLGRGVHVFSIDTGRLPEETYECANRVSDKYDIPIHWVFPRHEAVEEMVRAKGIYSFKDSVENRKECCGIRKVEPLDRALEPFDAWFTGRRAEQSKQRESLELVEPDPVHPGKFKVNPFLHWTKQEIWTYVREHKVPHNRLYDQGYLSIGCECCTRPCVMGDDERAGRWWWESAEHKECGIHLVFENGSGI